MSARRLTVARGGGLPRRVLPGVPAPLRGQARAHSLAQALEIALDYAGTGLDYDAIMGLSGLAFRTPHWPGEPGPSREEWLDAIAALQSVLTAQITVYGSEGPPDPTEAMVAVAAAIEAGVPCVALGWGSVKEEWSVIAGYDQAKGALAGHCLLDEPRGACESWPAELDLLVVPPPEVAVAVEAVIPALVAAAQACVESMGDEPCRAWAEAIWGASEPPDTAHERAVQLLADSRTAAVAFLGRLADVEDSIRGQWLARAARHLDDLILLVEGRGGPPLSPEAAMALADRAGRAKWAARLEEIARVDALAFAALRRSLDADFPPGEDAF